MMHSELLDMTEPAAQHIAHILAGHEGAIGLSLSIKEGKGCSGYRYALQCMRDQDRDPDKEYILIHHPGQQITLFVDPEWASAFNGTTIDLVDETLGQKRLVFNNPNTTQECGCGESFSFKEPL